MQFMKAFYQHLFTDGQSEEAHATIQTGLQLYEKELERRQQPGPFFGGRCLIKKILIASKITNLIFFSIGMEVIC